MRLGQVGQPLKNNRIAVLIRLFYYCHEWQTDGNMATSKYKKNQCIPTGFFHRLNFPFPGGMLKQPALLMEAFEIIKEEELKILYEKIK